ncbi:hypothetical protein ACLKA7_004977 [Drosophila subpalustris]
MAKVLAASKIIIWDECTMAHKRALEALNRTLKDLRKDSRCFGGAMILLSGDFRQILPVIPRSTAADEINACLKSSNLWRYVKKLQMTTNMRVTLLNDTSAKDFSEQLLTIGDASLNNPQVSVRDSQYDKGQRGIMVGAAEQLKKILRRSPLVSRLQLSSKGQPKAVGKSASCRVGPVFLLMSTNYGKLPTGKKSPIEVEEQAILFTPPPRASKRNLILWDNLDLSLNAPTPGICRQLDLISFC